jgi:DNA-binding NarL/FixJ family response regulator
MTDDSTSIRVMVVDDQAVVRIGLAAMIDAEADLATVGMAADGAEAVVAARQLRPDVVLMDVRMPRLDGIGATRAIIEAGTAGAVVIVTTFDDEEYLVEAVRAGASGFLLKDAGPDLIAAGIRAAHIGDSLIAPSMTRSLLEYRLEVEGSPAADGGDPARNAILDSLSARERDVLAAVAQGASNSEIARALWVSEGTVKTHLRRIMTKTGAVNRVQVAVFAYESGFVRPGALESDG